MFELYRHFHGLQQKLETMTAVFSSLLQLGQSREHCAIIEVVIFFNLGLNNMKIISVVGPL